jgi:hypothetical protein
VAAITHQTNTAGDYLGDPNDEQFALARPYFTPWRYTWNTQTVAGEPVQLHGEHRSLAAYSLALEHAGFAIQAIREPAPNASFLAARPEAAYAARLPLFLNFRAIKT